MGQPGGWTLDFFNFQPTELVKLSCILWTANYLSEHVGPLDLKDCIKIGFVMGIPVLLIVKQPDLGSGINILLLVGGMMLFYGIKKRILISILIIVPLLAPFVWNHMHDYQKDRIRVLFNPDKYKNSKAYNIRQSKIAVGSGGFWGKGFFGRHPE